MAELALGSQLACKLLLFPLKCTIGNLSPLSSLQSCSRPSSSSHSSSPSSSTRAPGASIFVTCNLIRISRIAVSQKQSHISFSRLTYRFLEVDNTFFGVYRVAQLVRADAVGEIKCVEIVVIEEADNTHPGAAYAVGVLSI